MLVKVYLSRIFYLLFNLSFLLWI